MQSQWLRALTTAVGQVIKKRQLYPPSLVRSKSRPRPAFSFPRLRIWLIGEPGVLPDPEVVRELRKMGKAAFYAVQKGHKPGIYTTWSECEAQVKGFQGATFKKFPNQRQAEEFIRSGITKAYSKPTTTESKPDAAASRPARSKDLPEDLAALVNDGFTITLTKPHHLVVYTDGSSRGNGKTGARAGLGVWWSDKRPASKLNLAERLPGAAQTNNRGELLAIIRALEVCPYPKIPLEIRTDSKYSISCMTVYLPKWIRNGFKTAGPDSTGIKNKDLILHLLSLLHDRGPGNGVKFKHVAAHCGEVGNEGADRLANQGAMAAEVPERLDWRTPEDAEQVVDREQGSPVDVEIEVDENWMMSPDEMAALEAEL